MDLSSHRALKYTHIVRPVAKFVHEKVEEQTGKMKDTKKSSRGSILNVSPHFAVNNNTY